MVSTPLLRATLTRWLPTKTKHESLILYSLTAGKSRPLWNARSTLFHLSARLAFVGMKARSKASWRPTLPTIFETSTSLRPKRCLLCARCPFPTSSKASSRVHSRRKRAATRPKKARRRARSKSTSACTSTLMKPITARPPLSCHQNVVGKSPREYRRNRTRSFLIGEEKEDATTELILGSFLYDIV